MKEKDALKYWSMSAPSLMQKLSSSADGLSGQEAASRLREYGENAIKPKVKTAPVLMFLSQFKNPIVLIMISATLISAGTGDWVDSLIILAIVLGSAVLSFMQEHSASRAIEMLQSKVAVTATVIRGGKPLAVPSREVVAGDVIALSMGNLIPADGLILEANDLFVNQAILTGEAIPAEKKAEPVQESANIAGRVNCVFMGTNVSGGSGLMLAVRTGADTEYGQIAKHLKLRAPETEFERGVRRFGYLLTELMLILTLSIFAINVMLERPVADSLLFSVALAVGITPQLLPAIINIALTRGARVMAKEGVVVRRLNAIENFGSMDVLCTDKTGTITEGVVRLDRAVATTGKDSETVLRLAYINSNLQAGIRNPLDKAIVEHGGPDLGQVRKVHEIPYDFFRKRLSVLVEENGELAWITKGALKNVLDVCDKVRDGSSTQPLDQSFRGPIQERFSEWSNQGFRVLGVASRATLPKDKYGADDEKEMTFEGFLLFMDPPKEDVALTIKELAELGVQLRIITGDNLQVALHTAKAVGMTVDGTLTGDDIARLSDEAFWNVAKTTSIFAEVDPNQKERIIQALRKTNHVVGYMGDGINDASALHAADVGISVNTAADVAREASDFVLLERRLSVLKRGIELGRATFANTLKYIFVTTSANFGNMFSMAGASLFMPFLPLLPKQVLLINFLSDFPAMTLADDAVDDEIIRKPRTWNIGLIRRFMFTFGLISSVFDYLTFYVLLVGFKASEGMFRSGWFTLSVLTELFVLLLMRTQKPFVISRPAPILLYSTAVIGAFTMLLPYLPFRALFNIEPLPMSVVLALLGIVLLYILVTEIAKKLFYKHNPPAERRSL